MFDKIRATIRRIPRGQVATYGQVAEAAGFPGCARQVVWALRDSDKHGVPWHRVLAAGGHIRLPGESGLEQSLRQIGNVRLRATRVANLLREPGKRCSGQRGRTAGEQHDHEVAWRDATHRVIDGVGGIE